MNYLKDVVIKYRVVIILIIGFTLRLAYVGRIPGNYNFFQDEAFSAYEAYSLSTYGIDSHGYHNPVYLEVWGSGMSAMQCYCQILFIKIWGFGPLAIRLPQALLGCATLIFFYFLIKEVSDIEVASWATFIMAICPWHITLTRWGFDCNYFVGLITIAMSLLVNSKNRLWMTVIAGIFTGLSLYGYASPWVVMPVLVLGVVVYYLVKKEMTISCAVVYLISTGIIALPLLLFVAINMDIIPEITTGFISIPKLGYFRHDEVGISWENVKRFFTFIWTQYDYCSWNSTPKWGLFFLFSNIFLIVGIIKEIVRPGSKSIIMWIWLICGIILGSMVVTNFNRVNIVFIPILYFIASGIVFVVKLFKKYSYAATTGMILVYGITGIMFAKFYFTDFNEMIERVFTEGTEEAIVFAQSYDTTVHVQDIVYPFVLCYSKYPVEQFVDTVVYSDPNAEFLSPVSFEGYDMTDFSNSEPVEGEVYICSTENTACVEWLANHDMSCAQFGVYYVGVAN